MCCDDPDRGNGNLAKADMMLSLCDGLNRIPASMNNDRSTICGVGVAYKR
jgi:hypothetical protein